MTTFSARIEQGVAAFREWQRSAINWREMVRRADVADESRLSALHRGSEEREVRAALTAAQKYQ